MRLHCITFFVKPHTMKHVFACIILAICLQAAQKPVKEKTTFPLFRRLKTFLLLQLMVFAGRSIYRR